MLEDRCLAHLGAAAALKGSTPWIERDSAEEHSGGEHYSGRASSQSMSSDATRARNVKYSSKSPLDGQ